MERAGPRIYVPLALPDHGSAQPTYAVLEFVGFSSPAPSPSAPHLLHPSSALPSPPPAMLCLPPGPSSAAPPPFFPISTHPVHPLISFPHNTLISAPSQFTHSHFPDHNSLYLPSPPHLQAHQPCMLPSSRLDIVNLESPPSSPSSLTPSSASSVSRDSSKDKYPHSSAHVANLMGATSVVSPTGLNKPMASSFCSSPSDAASSIIRGTSRPVVPFRSSSDGTLSKSMVNFSSAECGASGISKPAVSFNGPACEEGEVTPTQISVSQTDRETIVHTHSSNFRDVVRQLTGASSDDQDLLPVTLPARLANRVNYEHIVRNGNINTEIIVPVGAGPCAGSCGGGGASTGASKDQLGLRRAPLKLHERRKSTMKNLEKVTTAFNFHAATELSPLNPSPVTPLASDFERFCNASTPTSQGNSGLSSPINLISKGRSSLDQGSNERRVEHQQESGSFYMQRPPPASARPLPLLSPPEKVSPTLLSLFPESPACSPRDQ